MVHKLAKKEKQPTITNGNFEFQWYQDNHPIIDDDMISDYEETSLPISIPLSPLPEEQSQSSDSEYFPSQ